MEQYPVSDGADARFTECTYKCLYSTSELYLGSVRLYSRLGNSLPSLKTSPTFQRVDREDAVLRNYVLTNYNFP
jgi:hypothetical protein